ALHQLGLVALEQSGRKPGQLARHLADRNHLVHRGHVAKREHGLKLLVAAHLAGLDRNAAAAAGGASDFCWEHSDVSFADPVMQWIRLLVQGFRWRSTTPRSAAAPAPTSPAA